MRTFLGWLVLAAWGCFFGPLLLVGMLLRSVGDALLRMARLATLRASAVVDRIHAGGKTP